MLNKINGFLKKNPSALQIIIFVAFVMILFLVIVFQSLSIMQLRYHTNSLEEQIFHLENENKLLIKEKQKMSTERYIEEFARDKLGMVRTGEIPVQVNETIIKDEREEVYILDSRDKAAIYLKEWYEELRRWFDNSKKKG